MIRVVIPSPLRSYTAERALVEASGASVDEVLHDLERRHPGIRFRMIDEQGAVRAHIKLFVNRQPARNLAQGVAPGDELLVITAISGG